MNNLVKEISKRHGGTFTRVSYKSDVTSKLKAEVRKRGVRVEKIVETTARTGVRYNMIANVIAKKSERDSDRNYTNPYVDVIPNRIKHHEAKGIDYITLATIPSKQANTKTKYIVIDENGNVSVTSCLSNIADLFQPSYIGNAMKHERPDVITVKLENILKFNGVAA